MTKTISRFLAAVLIGGSLLAAPAASLANQGDCGQPNGPAIKTKPTVGDALAILKEAVGQTSLVTSCDAKPCICDVDSKGGITTTDALRVLKLSVSLPVTLTCTCGPTQPACTSAEFASRPGSDLDSGWTGLAHNSDIIRGASIKFQTLRRCSTTTSTVCETAADCPGGETCKPTCDCDSDTTCEIQGPTHQKNCLNSLKDCSTNSDCTDPVNNPCVAMFGPPLPLSSGGTPACVVSVFDGPLTGTADSSNGTAVTASNLKSRVFLGIAQAQPCPRCGKPSENPKIGASFKCEGGLVPGGNCTVDGVSPTFGGTSYDCPPSTSNNISGTGLAIRFSQVTTGTTSKTAQVPCSSTGFKNNPLSPGSNPKCIDRNSSGDPVCSSNADCKRCTGDPTVDCANNADCSGIGTCAEAPDQPITCGYWCSCGFCTTTATPAVQDPSLPCFESADCPAGSQCKQGVGVGTVANAPQTKPNDCGSTDKFICGLFNKEECPTSTAGSCSLQPYKTCSTNSQCSGGGGVCDIKPRPCFESRITRTGSPSPLGKFCGKGTASACTTNADCQRCSGDTSVDCTTNADCGGAFGTCGATSCEADSSAPSTVALFCVPGTASSAINSAGGITGPGAINLNGYIKVCRCGDSVIGCDETCDDGNTANGDGCNDRCRVVPVP